MNSKAPKQPFKLDEGVALMVGYSESCDLWIGAFRYYLGRMTASVHSFCASLVKNWESIPEVAQNIIKRDLLDGIRQDDNDRLRETETGCLVEHKYLGHNCDSEKWRYVLNEIKDK